MKRLFGYVLVRESNYGVPKLVVTAYDSEQPIREVTANYEKKQDFLIESVGKRIGSVLTDQEGRFILTSEDLEFQGNESRPDLLLIVFAPEDIQKIDEPYPLPPEKRVLYISSVARADAGAEEAFVIRLLQAQLDRFDISAGPSGKDSEAHSTRLASAIESTWNLQDSLREKLKPRLQKEQAKSDKFRKIAREKVRHLSAIPLHLRDDKKGTNPFRNNSFLISDRKDLAKKLKSFQDGVISDGLQRMGTNTPTLRLTLTKEDLKDLGLPDSGTQASGIDSQQLAEKVRSLTQGADLVRVRGLNNPSPDELEKKYLSGGEE